MENEVISRINAVKNTCKRLDKDLHKLYERLEGENARAIVLNEVRDDIIKVQKIFYDANALNLIESEVSLSVLKDDLYMKYGASTFERSLVVSEEKRPVVKPLADEPAKERVVTPVQTKEVVVEKKDNSGAILAGVLGGAILGGLTVYGFSNKDKWNRTAGAVVVNNNNNNEAIVENTFEGSVDSVEPAPVQLLPGEYGTFLDVNDDAQVQARAEYIYNNYLSTFKDKLCPADREIVEGNGYEDAISEIANTIRVVNGILPVDENGNKFFDANTEDYYLNRLVDYVANIPSCDQMGTIEYVPGYLFAEDNSKLSEFIKSYDDIYKNIADARNERDGLKLRKNVQIMAAKYWTEWFLQGMGGNIVYDNEAGTLYYDNVVPECGNFEGYVVRNPYALNDTYKAHALWSTLFRYGSFIYEAEHNQMATVCIPACINYETKEMEELSIDQIYTAIDSGVWNNVIAKSAGMEAPKDPVSVGFWEALDAQLNFVYEHSDSLTLK